MGCNGSHDCECVMLADGSVGDPVGPPRHPLQGAFANETSQVLPMDGDLPPCHEGALLRACQDSFPSRLGGHVQKCTHISTNGNTFTQGRFLFLRKVREGLFDEHAVEYQFDKGRSTWPASRAKQQSW